MTRDEIKLLLTEIHKVYPRFEASGVDAWATRLTDVSFNKALKVLEKWIDGDRGDYSPTLAYFIKQSREGTVSDAFLDRTPRRYHVSKHGELLDEDGREYGGTYADGSPYRYYYNKLGYICRKDDMGNEVWIA